MTADLSDRHCGRLARSHPGAWSVRKSGDFADLGARRRGQDPCSAWQPPGSCAGSTEASMTGRARTP